ncbi:RNA-binding protein 45 [Fukomys damarensis]|uniref:RNA-binding protein 45 n=1 Tax=Fukomys damarensis TaxID=885580 RepID=A0A091DYS4_FUKDA|nr:RNA-binding protein 45 [Fukomys damarensis]
MDEAGSSAGGGGSSFRPGVDSLDEPPNSRIFLVISKYTPEAVLRERFSPFGEIQDIWVVRDKHTKESKGIAFIKFARSSQACRAMEEMHGQCLEPNNTKPIKIYSVEETDKWEITTYRFGNLIEVYLVSGKNVGYAKFADRMSANDAIATLHGKILNGVRLKVMLADSPREESNKRQRTY